MVDFRHSDNPIPFSKAGREKVDRSNDLLSCPFCGGKARVDNYESTMSNHKWWQIECLKCLVRTYPKKTRKGAVALWNKRKTR